MAMKHISDKQACEAHAGYKREIEKGNYNTESPQEILSRQTGQCEKVCFRVSERAYYRGFLDYGVSLRSAWLTEKGEALVQGVKVDQG